MEKTNSPLNLELVEELKSRNENPRSTQHNLEHLVLRNNWAHEIEGDRIPVSTKYI